MTTAVGLRSSRGPVLLAVMVSTGVVAIDATVIATAVPSIVGDLGGFSSFPWLFSVYLLASAVTVPVYAKLADTVGRRPIVLVGLSVFLLGSILCAVAWDMPSLIVSRAVQGVGAGAILPVTITMVGDMYTVRERARVQGYLASVWAAASVLGPTLGGVFAQLDAWRGIFVINIPLCVAAGWLLIRNFRETFERRPHRVDFAGALTFTAAMTLLMLGVLQGGTAWEWGSPQGIGVFAAGGALLLAFVLIERRAAEPILPAWLFGRRVLLTTTLVGFGVGAGLIGLTAFVPTYLQGGLGVPPLVAGLALATLTIGWPIASSLSGRVYLRLGFRTTTLIGGTVVVAGATLLAVFGMTPSIALVALACFVVGLGFGFSAVPSLVAAQSSVQWGERGVVTGTNMFVRSLGQAIGAAVFGAVANAVIAVSGGDHDDPAALIAGSTAVFVGVVVVAVLLVAAAAAMPRDRAASIPHDRPAEPDAASDPPDGVPGREDEAHR